jgi:phospholipid/cholesterol/gamma-HCH transport system substrate-binding protein
MKISKEFKIGLFAIIAGILLFSGYNFLKGYDFMTSLKTYQIIYDRVDGLTVSNPVMLNGLAVGKVQSIEILQEENHKLKVIINVDNNIKLGDSTKAVLTDNGLIGGKMIDLKIGKVIKALPNKSSLIPVRDKGLLGVFQDKGPDLINKVDSIMFKVNKLLGEFSGIGTKFNNIMGNVEGLTNTLKVTVDENKNALTSIVGDFKKISSGFVEDEKSLKPILANFNTLSQKLSQLEIQKTMDGLDEALKKVNVMLEKINKGDGTLGALLNNDSLYTNLTNVGESLNKLLIDVRENPKRYIKITVFPPKEKEQKK